MAAALQATSLPLSCRRGHPGPWARAPEPRDHGPSTPCLQLAQGHHTLRAYAPRVRRCALAPTRCGLQARPSSLVAVPLCEIPALLTRTNACSTNAGAPEQAHGSARPETQTRWRGSVRSCHWTHVGAWRSAGGRTTPAQARRATAGACPPHAKKNTKKAERKRRPLDKGAARPRCDERRSRRHRPFRTPRPHPPTHPTRTHPIRPPRSPKHHNVYKALPTPSRLKVIRRQAPAPPLPSPSPPLRCPAAAGPPPRARCRPWPAARARWPPRR